jgi:hypothetical protein
MCLVLFGWMTSQRYFREYVEVGIRQIYAESLARIEEEMLPVGFYDDGSRQIIDDEVLYDF